jgi:hypothetical protein
MERAISGIAVGVALAGLLFGLIAPALAQASNDDTDRPSRPRVTIYPRHYYLGPSAKRHCRSWLTKEYRVSGPVIVPQMRCWWE